MTSQKVEKYLTTKLDATDDQDIAELLQQIHGYYINKLWNQLTIATKKLIGNKKFVDKTDLSEFYENFVKDFEHRIEPLELTELVIRIAEYTFSKKGHQDAYDFLQKFEKIVESDKKALVRLYTGIIHLRLEDINHADLNESKEKLALVRKLIEDTQTKLDELVEVGPVHAAFYKVSSIYYHKIKDHARYYTEALRYLGCEDVDSLPDNVQVDYAEKLSEAALLGKGVYNFGELLAHPVLNVLSKTDKAWLVEVLYALNAGDWEKFQMHKKKLENSSKDIRENMNGLEEKLRLLCLMEMAMRLPPKHRRLLFNDISKSTHLAEDKVELLVMKALANGLVQGYIDEVSQLVTITWVQPRVLSAAQIQALAERMNEWRTDVNRTQSYMADNAREIIMTYT